jgi:tRNA-modifying protein YgfZ
MASYMALLPDRGVVSVIGADAEKFLAGLITNDMALLSDARAIYAGLLTPQGKVLFDFFVLRNGDGFLLDVARDQASALTKRLMLYKLRAAVEIADVSQDYAVAALWNGGSPVLESGPRCIVFPDPRLREMGARALIQVPLPSDLGGAGITAATDQDYLAHRVRLGVPEGGKDYVFGDTFPHEALFDQLGGVSFTKGCYVGQEVVSRMQHRATVRKRIVPVTGREDLPAGGIEIMAGDVAIGTLGSVSGRRGLALLRLDRAQEFKSRGVALSAGGIAIEVEAPAFATFSLEAI